MSSSGRNDVTSRPTDGIVHRIAMRIAANDAHGEDSRPLVAIARRSRRLRRRWRPGSPPASAVSSPPGS
jgi:hypothetical protein